MQSSQEVHSLVKDRSKSGHQPTTPSPHERKLRSKSFASRHLSIPPYSKLNRIGAYSDTSWSWNQYKIRKLTTITNDWINYRSQLHGKNFPTLNINTRIDDNLTRREIRFQQQNQTVQSQRRQQFINSDMDNGSNDCQSTNNRREPSERERLKLTCQQQYWDIVNLSYYYNSVDPSDQSLTFAR